MPSTRYERYTSGSASRSWSWRFAANSANGAKSSAAQAMRRLASSRRVTARQASHAHAATMRKNGCAAGATEVR
jgi:hypothetical protein